MTLAATIEGLLGLAFLYFGGGALIRGASELATRLGISPVVVGLTVVAFGTSAPELVVSLDAALSGASDLAVGNIVGSNIANIGVILGLAAAIRPMTVKARIVRVDAPLSTLVSVGLVAVMLDGVVSRTDGGLLLLGLVGYVALQLRESPSESPEVVDEFASEVPAPTASAGVSLVRIVAGLALLLGGGHLFVGAAVTMASAMGMSQAVIGLTVVAIGTSLPELSTSLLAAARGHGDIAIGNVVGSNMFNVLGILGVTALVHPPETSGITGVDLASLVGFSIAASILLLTRMRLDRIEGVALFLGYVAYSAWLLAG